MTSDDKQAAERRGEASRDLVHGLYRRLIEEEQKRAASPAAYKNGEPMPTEHSPEENARWLAERRTRRVAGAIGKTPTTRSNQALYNGGLVHPDSVSHGVMPPVDAQVAAATHASAARRDDRAAAFIGAMAGRQRAQREQREQRREALLYQDAFSSYLRRGLRQMPSEQRAVLETGFQAPPEERETRDLGVASGAVGGYLVPQAFADRIVRGQKLVGGVRTAAYIYHTETGATMPVPMDNDTANVGELLAENTVAGGQDTTVTSKSLGAYLYSSKAIKVAIQLTQDFAFDLDTWLATKLGIRLGRIQNQHFTTGTGTAQPQGVVTGASLGKTGLAGQTTSIIYDDLVDLLHAVDPAYRGGRQLLKGDIGDDPSILPNPAWMMTDGTLKAIEKIKDSQNRPLWQPGLSADAPDTILGYPIVINQDMASMATSAKSVLFGDFSNYVIREVNTMSVLRLTERYADALQVGYIAFDRADGALVDAGTHPIAYYQNSAS